MKVRRKFNYLRMNTSGFVLTEMIAAFTLTAILFCSVIFVMSSGLRGFQRMQAGARAELVSELLLEKISGEIASAEPSAVASGSDWSFLIGDAEESVLYPADGREMPAAAWIAFENRYGTPEAIYAAEEEDGMSRGSGYLYIRYYADDGDFLYVPEEICWHFDSKVYMGFRISRLLFSHPSPERRNVFRIDLELEHEQTGWKHASYCYIKNINLSEDSVDVLTEQGKTEPGSTDVWAGTD